jgi:hypothetical protein
MPATIGSRSGIGGASSAQSDVPKTMISLCLRLHFAELFECSTAISLWTPEVSPPQFVHLEELG